jgi:hypothetical protein
MGRRDPELAGGRWGKPGLHQQRRSLAARAALVPLWVALQAKYDWRLARYSKKQNINRDITSLTRYN